MTRPKNPQSVPPLEEVDLYLLIRPAEGHEYSPEELEELEAAWWAYRDQLLEEWADRPWKPWAYWQFEARQPMPPD